MDWITFWGLIIFNTLGVTGDFERFKTWIVHHATNDIRIQTLMLAWAFGALLEGVVGFGYPWAVVAPILIGFGIADLDAIRVAALANNAPVSYGALGAPIIALAAVTGLPLMALSASIGNVVAVLALLPPWILLYLVSGRKVSAEAWPLADRRIARLHRGAVAGRALSGPVSAGRHRRARVVLGIVPVHEDLAPEDRARIRRQRDRAPGPAASQHVRRRRSRLRAARVEPVHRADRGGRRVDRAVVEAARLQPREAVGAGHQLDHAAAVRADVQPEPAERRHRDPRVVARAAGASCVRRSTRSPACSASTFHQMWGALLVGFFIFGLAFAFVYSGMANSMAYGCSKVGLWFVVLAPILGWVGVALSGSNTSTNAMFGPVQMVTGRLLNLPPLLLPSFNSVGAEVGKPIAPQTASVGVSTSRFVRSEGDVIRHNMGWTLVLLAYLVLIAVVFYYFLPNAMAIS